MRLNRAAAPPESDRARGFELAGLDRYLPDLPMWQHWDYGGQNLAVAAGATVDLLVMAAAVTGVGPAHWIQGVAFVSDLPWDATWSLRVRGIPVFSQVAVPISATLADLRPVNLKIPPGPLAIHAFVLNAGAVALQAEFRISGYSVGPATRGA